MANPSQIVSQINLLVASQQGVTESQLKEAAAAFAQLCRDVNERLARVQSLLAAGLRSEALYVAEVEPSILVLFRAIEQSRHQEWDRVCAERGLDRFPPINTEGIRQLKDASAAEHAIKPILKRHRRLALCQAPLRERLDALRELARADAGNPIWDQDVKNFESARIAELNPMLKVPGAVTDIKKAQELVRELTDEGWRIKIPAELVDNARRAVQRLQGAEAIKEAKSILPRVHEAHKAHDLQAVKSLVNELNEVFENRGAIMPAEMQTELLNIFEWIKREDLRHEKQATFNDACTQLRAALDRKAVVAEITRLWEAAREFEMALPDELEREAQLRIRNFELARRRRTQLVVALITLTIVGVLAGVAREFRERSLRNKIATAQQQVNSALASDRPDLATAALDALAKESPSAMARPDVTALREAIAKKIAEEEQRKQEFASLLEATVGKGPEAATDEAVAALQALAKLDSEKESLTRFLRSVDAAREVRQASVDLEFTQKAQALSKHLAAVAETRADTDPAGLSAELDGYEKQLAILDGARQVSSDTRLRLEPIKARLRTLRSAVKLVTSRRENDIAFRNAIESLADSVWSPTQHKQRLEAVADEFPANARAAGLRNAAQQVNAWVAVQKWSQLTEGWNRKLAADRSSIDERLRAVEEYVRKNPGTPVSAAADDYLAYLRAAEVAIADKGPWRDVYKRYLASPLIHDLSRIKINTGKTYYVIQSEGNPRINSVGTSFQAILSSDINKPTSLEFKPGMASKIEPSPQMAFSKIWLARIADLRDQDWDTFGLEAAYAVVSARDVDPLLRLIMLQKVVAGIRKCVWGIEDFDTLARKIEAKVITDEAWLNPDDQNAPALRNSIADFLAALPNFEAMIEEVKRRRAALFRPLQFEVVSNGVAIQNGTDWRVLVQTRGGRDIKNGHRLLITADKGRTLREIGTVTDGKPVVDLTRMIGVDEGTLVFICNVKSE